jgi:dihydroneopterin aldolase
MKSRIHIRDVHCQAHIGVPSLERESLQEIRVDVLLDVDVSQAVEKDDISKTVDYEEVVDLLQQAALSRPVSLIETLAEKMARELLRDSRIQSLRLTVRKFPKVLLDRIDYVAVEVNRTRE